MDDRIDVSRDRLELLLYQRAESEGLDFKYAIDFQHDKDGLIELAKDVAAFSDHGGWLIIGVDNDGAIHGISADSKAKLDESRLRSGLERYLSPGFRIYTAFHRIGADKAADCDLRTVAILQVLPHPDGACIMKSIGEKSTDNKPTFREGEIFTRRGTASTRARQEDVSRILNKRAVIAQNAEFAARTARTAAYTRLGNPTIDGPVDGYLWLRLGWATSHNPSDLSQRIFYARDSDKSTFEDWFKGQLENKYLRHEGHYYQYQLLRQSDMITGSGLIKNSDDEPSAYVDVRVHGNGWISIGVCEYTTDWDADELFGWWVYGACTVAHSIIARLGLTGTQFTCIRCATGDKLPWADEIEISINSGLPATSLTEVERTAHQETLQFIEEIRNKFQLGAPLSLVPGSDFNPPEAHAKRVPGRSFRH